MTCNPKLELLDLAARQHGAFSRSQARHHGFTDRMIDRRLEAGEWSRLHRGVYRFAAAPPTTLMTISGALLAIPGSVVSHESAAELFDLQYVPRGRAVITTTPGSNHDFEGVTVHEYAGIDDARTEVVQGLRVVPPALTVMHLSAVMRPWEVERVMDDGLASRKVAWEELCALGDFWTRKGRRGGRAMRRLIESRGPGFVATESRLEKKFVQLLDREGLPQPTRQFVPPWERGAGRVDFAYLHKRILIELDGRRWHTREADFQKDRERDRAAQLAGWVVLRFTWHEVTVNPHETVLVDLRRALGRGSGQNPP